MTQAEWLVIGGWWLVDVPCTYWPLATSHDQLILPDA
jgi:hypothetical protein